MHEVIATVCGLGYSPIASGTVGSLAGLGLYLILHNNPLVQFVSFVILFILGVISSGVIEDETGEKDPSKVVIDEFACILIAFLFVPYKLLYIVAGFIIYRIIDIIKIPPMAKLEGVRGGWGIMLDDLVGAIYTNIILQVLAFLFH